eukprot:378302-Rhodomonas_salina.2
MLLPGGAVRVVPSAVGDHAFYKVASCAVLHGEEFNCYYDPKALKNILHSGLDVTMIGLFSLKVVQRPMITVFNGRIQRQEVANATVATPALLDTLAHAEVPLPLRDVRYRASSGTEMRMVLPGDLRICLDPTAVGTVPPMLLRISYAMSGTGI